MIVGNFIQKLKDVYISLFAIKKSKNNESTDLTQPENITILKATQYIHNVISDFETELTSRKSIFIDGHLNSPITVTYSSKDLPQIYINGNVNEEIKVLSSGQLPRHLDTDEQVKLNAVKADTVAMLQSEGFIYSSLRDFDRCTHEDEIYKYIDYSINNSIRIQKEFDSTGVYSINNSVVFKKNGAVFYHPNTPKILIHIIKIKIDEYINNNTGITVLTDFSTQKLKNEVCRFELIVYTNNSASIDSAQTQITKNIKLTQVSFVQLFSPEYIDCSFTDFPIFIPAEKLDNPQDISSLKLAIRIFGVIDNEEVLLAQSEMIPFDLV